MTDDQLYSLAEKARKEAIAKALRDPSVWSNQLMLVLTSLLKIACVHIVAMLFLSEAGVPAAAAYPAVFMLTTILCCLNPWNTFVRVLFHEIGESAFDAVVDQHRKKR